MFLKVSFGKILPLIIKTVAAKMCNSFFKGVKSVKVRLYDRAKSRNSTDPARLVHKLELVETFS